MRVPRASSLGVVAGRSLSSTLRISLNAEMNGCKGSIHRWSGGRSRLTMPAVGVT